MDTAQTIQQELTFWSLSFGIKLSSYYRIQKDYAKVTRHRWNKKNEAYSRQQAHMETLKKKAMKLEQSKQNLNTAYIDPEIRMTKAEYLEQKAKIDDELRIINEEIDKNSIPLINLPSLAELQTLETFSAQICRKLDLVDPPPQEKRKLFELLHINVVISLDGSVDIEGWFAPQEDDGLMNRLSLWRAVPRRYPPPLRR